MTTLIKSLIDRASYGNAAFAHAGLGANTPLSLTIPPISPRTIIVPIRMRIHSKWVGARGLSSLQLNPLMDEADARFITISRFKNNEQVSSSPTLLEAVSDFDRMFKETIEVSDVLGVGLAGTELKIEFDDVNPGHEEQYILVIYKVISRDILAPE